MNILILILASFLHFSASAKDGEELLKKLNIKSVNSILPNNTKTVVSLGVTLQSLSYDEYESTLTTNIWLNMAWSDPKLTWNPDDHEGIKHFTAPVDQIWTPDIFCYNAIHDKEQSYMFNIGAVVDNHGSVLYVPPLLLKSTCEADLTAWPYDEQKCEIKFGSWTHHGGKIELQSNSEEMDISTYSESKNWELVYQKGKRNVINYACCPEEYHDIQFTLLLKRRPNGVPFLYTGPGLCLLGIQPLLFLLPFETSEKTILGTGIMISTAVIMNSFPDVISVKMMNPPALLKYYTITLVMAAIGIILTHVLAVLYGMDIGCQIPQPLKRCFCACLGRSGTNLDADGQLLKQSQPISDWRLLVTLIDRILFIIFVLIVIVTMLSLLG